MGLLNLFAKPAPVGLHRLPNGSLTVDRQGRIVASTIPSSVDPDLVAEIGGHILRLFREAHKAQMSLTELNLHFSSLQITAREMRGGAVIFLKPKDLFTTSRSNGS